MLVLSRKLDEVIRIGNDVEITVLAVKGNTVRLGIKAPRDVKVLRAELPINETQATVTAIVDSPTAADQSVFVGNVRSTGLSVDLPSQATAESEQGSDAAAVRLAKGASPTHSGSLRAYLREHHNSTAV